jgi:peptide/nickel transport system substrate-binding protein
MKAKQEKHMRIHLFNRFSRVMIFAFFLSALLASCGGQPLFQRATATTVPTATPIPEKTLTVCVGDEPGSLYMYANSSQAMWSILEGIYDGPVDTVDYQPQAVILTAIPTLENGGITIQSAPVTAGDLVANVEGDVVALAEGVKVFPEGCTTHDCIITWDGTSELNLSQMVVKFSLLSDLKWSDGQALTADDSVYSFEIAKDPATNVSREQVKRTQHYVTLDDRSVEWTGLPGYLTLNPATYFWIPLPKHQLSRYTAEQLTTAEETNRSPLGWGPYMISDWQSGKQIKLVKNPNYFRASEGLPKYDAVIYKFLGNLPEADISPVVTGECDIIDTSVSMADDWQTIRSLELEEKAKGYFEEGSGWEGLNFGIAPASYDDFYNQYLERQDYFGDVRTRQAFAYCINRENIVENEVFSLGTVPDSYLASDHPFHVDGLAVYPYDPEKGKQLLNEVGWVDDDGDPVTPRIARGITTVNNNTPFEITYLATDSNLHNAIATQIQSDLQQCGVKVNISLQSIDQMYAEGPDGLVFGRSFDLAEFGWMNGGRPPCYLYSSSEIPTAKNNWLGTKYGVNITGYDNPLYDQACEVQLTSGLDLEGINQANTEAMTILATDLPVIPLFYDVSAMISRPDLCGLDFDASSRSGLRTIEAIEIGQGCPAE